MARKQELKEKERVKPVIVDETYIGSYIDSELGGKHVSNKSYEKYYGTMIKTAWNSKT